MKVSKKYIIWTIVVCVLALAINAYIVMHSCLNAEQSTKQSAGVVQVLENIINTIFPNTITPDNEGAFTSFIRKAFGHFGLFAVSGLFSSLAIFLILHPFEKIKQFIVIIGGLAYGLTIASLTEIIQLSIDGRSGEFTDVLIDFSGYLLGTLIIALIVFLVIKKKNKSSLEETKSL